MLIYNLQLSGQSRADCVDESNPRFSWKLHGHTGLVQVAYRIRVASAFSKLSCPDLWDSGEIQSRRTWAIPYEGSSLPVFSEVYWSVEVWGNRGEHALESSFFVTGRQDGPWPSSWFGPSETYQSMPLFRREFKLGKKWRKVLIFVCGLGSFEMHVNGVRVGTDELEPAWTNYDKSVLYTSYDVSDLLVEGANCVGLMLGNGMYHIDQSGTRFAYSRHSFGEQKASVFIKAWYSNGSIETFADAAGWFSAPGPITFSCIYGGEDYDARLEIPGFSQPGLLQDSRWGEASVVPPPKGQMRGRQHAAVKVRRRLSSLLETAMAPNTMLFDMGRNFAGRVQIIVQGYPGQTVRLEYAELLHNGQMIPFARGHEQYITQYTLGGLEPQVFCPRFTYLGFRYVKVITEAHVLELEGQELFADMPARGYFSCSNSMYNRIHSIIIRAMESNAKSVFTDCPHREKLGWLEQIHSIGPGLLSNFDAVPAYRKSLADMREAQLLGGLVPNIAPEYRVFDWMPGFRDSPEWGSACILAAWQAYHASGDRDLLVENYEMMMRYVRYLLDQSDHLILRYGLGDWLDVGSKKALAVNTPLPVTPTCILYLDLRALADIARVLGKDHDSSNWSDLAEQVRVAFNKEFFNERLGMYANGSQTSLAMPLLFGMVDHAQQERVLENLIDDIREKGNHVTSGDVGHAFVFEVLGKFGRSDVVADILAQQEYPGYGYHVLMGATTLPEAWDGAGPNHPKGSQNHFMMGGIDAWFFRHLAGIQAEIEDEAVRIRFAPSPVTGVEWARALLHTPAGVAESLWQRLDDDNIIRYKFTVPAGARATICLPGRKEVELEGHAELEYTS